MLKWALIFLVVAIVAGALHFGGVSFAASQAALILFWLFIVVTVVLFVIGLVAGKKVL